MKAPQKVRVIRLCCTLWALSSAAGCDSEAPVERSAPVPPPIVGTVAETAPGPSETDDPEREPEPPALPDPPEFAPFDREALGVGMERLTNCEEFEAFATEALRRHVIEEHYPSGGPGRPEVGRVQKSRRSVVAPAWPWLFVARGAMLGAVHAERAAARMVGEWRGGFDAFGAGAAVGTRTSRSHGVRHLPFGRNYGPGRSSQEWVDVTMLDVVSAGEQPKITTVRATGRVVATDVYDGDVYGVLSTELHATALMITTAKRKGRTAASREALEESLSPLRVRGTALGFPAISVMEPAVGDRGPREIAETKRDCGDVWIPRDERVRTDELLFAFRYDVERRRVADYVVVGGANAIAELRNGRLYVGRALRGGATKGADEQPASQVEIYSLEGKPELLSVTEVASLPVAFEFGGTRGWFVGTRMPGSEALRYEIVDETVAETFERSWPDVRAVDVVEPAGALPFELLFHRPFVGIVGSEDELGRLLATFGAETVAVSRFKDGLRATVVREDGKGRLTARLLKPRVVDWSPAVATRSGERVLVPVQLVDRPPGSVVQVTFQNDVLTTVVGPREALGWMARPDGAVAVTELGGVYFDRRFTQVGSAPWTD